jgi:hypothetical protein
MAQFLCVKNGFLATIVMPSPFDTKPIAELHSSTSKAILGLIFPWRGHPDQ